MLAISAGITELKAGLSEYLPQVNAGEHLVATERGQPIACFVPIAGSPSIAGGIQDLERAGILRRPLRPLDGSSWEDPRPRAPDGAVLAALLAEREEAR